MCGIAGILEQRGDRVVAEALTAMIGALSHRGPDDRGVYVNQGIGLAHSRLSIIDLEGGRQPMSTANGQLWITFNGEIFNYIELREELIRKGHTFTTRSDTEVILHLYQEEGETCVNRLNGQWAFAIWDAARQRLFLSRDGLGVRPLFYTRTSERFLFASEIKALLTQPDVDRQLDLVALDQIFTFWVTLPPRTAFKNVQQLPPGHSLVLESGAVRIWQYWCLDYTPQQDDENTSGRLAEELLALLLDATRIRLRADVPVGSYLSGGLDSTIVTALAKSLVGDRLRTFSVTFDDPEFDESAYQHEASEFLHTQHSSVRCSYADIATVLPKVVRHTEQPILRTAPAPLMLLAKLVHSEGFKVVLTGEGADELFGGYDIFKEAKVRRFWARDLESQRRPLLLKRLYPYLEGIKRQPAAYLKNFFCVSARDLESPFFSHLPRWQLTSKLKTFFSDTLRAELQSHNALADLSSLLPPAYFGWNAFNRAEYLETAYLLPGYILSAQGDRMAMAHAVEARYPFLDHRVVEFAARLSPNLKMKVLSQKYLLKRAAAGLIPKSIASRYKQPYRAPDSKSLFNSELDYVRDLLSPETIGKADIFDAGAVAALMAKFQQGRRASAKDDMALVGILSTQLFLEQFQNRRTDLGRDVDQPLSGLGRVSTDKNERPCSVVI